MEAADSVVLATASIKTASLFFPRVVPLNYWDMAKELKGEKDRDAFICLLPDLLPPSLYTPEFSDLLVELIDSTHKDRANTLENIGPLLVSATGRQTPYNSYEEILHDLDLDELDNAKNFWEHSSAFAEFIVSKIESPISGIIGLLPPLDMGAIKQESVSCLISGISVIDTERIAWDQILEIRTNPDAMRRLRKFRLFWHENFDGEDPEYIRDALAELKDKHAENLKSLGLPTFDSIFECIFSSEAFLNSSIMALLAGCMRAPVDSALISSLGAGIVTALNNIRIEFKNRRIEKYNFIKTDPLTYLFMDVNPQ